MLIQSFYHKPEDLAQHLYKILSPYAQDATSQEFVALTKPMNLMIKDTVNNAQMVAHATLLTSMFLLLADSGRQKQRVGALLMWLIPNLVMPIQVQRNPAIRARTVKENIQLLINGDLEPLIEYRDDQDRILQQAVAEMGEQQADQQLESLEDDDLLVALNKHQKEIKRRAASIQKLIGKGNLSKARQRLNDTRFADNDDAVIQTLRQLGGSDEEQLYIRPEQPLNQYPEQTFEDHAIFAAIKKIKLGTAAGPSNFNIDWVLHILMGQRRHMKTRDRFREALYDFIRKASNAKLSDVVFAQMFFCTLHKPIYKRDGNKIRDIEIPEALRRLVERVQFSHLVKDANKTMPNQYGAGCLDGANRFVQQTAMDLEHANRIIVGLDLKDAFNKISWKAILDSLELTLPRLVPYFVWQHARGGNPGVYIRAGRATSIEKRRGISQGATNSPLYFSKGVQPVLDRINNVPQVTGRGYMDDLTLTLTHDPAQGTWDELQGMGADLLTGINGRLQRIGLSLNAEKTQVYSKFCDVRKAFWPGPTEVINCQAGITILGVPMGSATFVEKQMDAKADELIDTIDRLQVVRNSQSEMLLLTKCLAQRLQYWLRALTPTETASAAARYTEAIGQKLNELHQLQLTKSELRWSTLPITMGGRGIQVPSDSQEPAYVGGFISALANGDFSNLLGGYQEAVLINRLDHLGDKVEIPDDDDREQALRQWRAETEDIVTADLQNSARIHAFMNTISFLLTDGAMRKKYIEAKADAEGDLRLVQFLLKQGSGKDGAMSLQRALTQQTYDQTYRDISQQLSPCQVALMLSQSQPHAQDYLKAHHQCPRTSFENEEFTRILQNAVHRLPGGEDLHQRNCDCLTRHGQQRPLEDGMHFELCPIGGGNQQQHDAIRDELATMMRSVSESRSSVRTEVNITGGRMDVVDEEIWVDVALVHQSTMGCVMNHHTDKNKGAAALQRQRQKHGKYDQEAAKADVIFRAVVFEAGGAWSPDATHFMTKYAHQAQQNDMQDSACFLNYWAMRVSCIIQKGRARASLRNQRRHDTLACQRQPYGQ